MKVVKPPTRSFQPYEGNTIFLAGSIEMGQAEDWQEYATKRIEKSLGFSALFNPRRDDWDPNWPQRLDNPQFYEQVTWEIDHLTTSTHILFNFIGGTKSPITLLELGLTATLDSAIIVVCPDTFWRKGNVDIVCQRLGYPVYRTLDEGLDALLF